jgi:hypothetical protein
MESEFQHDGLEDSMGLRFFSGDPGDSYYTTRFLRRIIPGIECKGEKRFPARVRQPVPNPGQDFINADG